MKKYLTLFLSLSLGFVLISFTQISETKENYNAAADHHFEIPDNVQKVIDKSCYGCHNSESQSEKGKKKLQWDNLGDMKTYKLVGKLTDICRVSWGKIKDINKKSILVSYQPLVRDSQGYQLGSKKDLALDWSEDILPEPSVGQMVSFHWGKICQVLDQIQTEDIKKYTKQNLAVFNAQHK